MTDTKKRLLVVDDEVNFAEFVRESAEDLGFVVEVKGNGHLAKEAITRFKPDAVVLDMVMPDTDGIEFLQWLAEKNIWPKIVLVTGFNPRYVELAERIGTARGAADITVLTKPIRISDLRKALGV